MKYQEQFLRFFYFNFGIYLYAYFLLKKLLLDQASFNLIIDLFFHFLFIHIFSSF